VSDHVEVGFKHVYFNSGILRLRHAGITYAGNPNRLTIAPSGGSPTVVDQAATAAAPNPE
jgi:hypothetical protein